MARDEAQRALNEAREFADAGEYAKALERHEWFHAHALEVDEAYTGVRLSFALSYWRNLAEAYPPALLSMRRIRDEATGRVLDAATGSDDEMTAERARAWFVPGYRGGGTVSGDGGQRQ